MSSPLSGRSAFPPVVGSLLADHGRSNFDMEVVAELPKFLGSAGVLEQNSIDVERIELASTVAIDGIPDARDQVRQLRVVIIRDHRARRLTLRLAGHDYEATHQQSAEPTHRRSHHAAGKDAATKGHGRSPGVVPPFVL